MLYELELNNKSYDLSVYTEDGVSKYSNKAMVEALKAIDCYKFRTVKITRDKIKLANDDIIVVINSPDYYFEKSLFKHTPNIAKVIKKSIAKFRTKEALSKNKDNIKFGTNVAIFSSLVAIAVASSIHFSKPAAVVDKTNKEIEKVMDSPDDSIDKLVSGNFNSNAEYNKKLEELLLNSNAAILAMPTIKNLLETGSLNIPENTIEDKKESIEEDKEIENNTPIATLSYEDRTHTITGENAYDAHHSTVEKYAKRYGVSPEIIMAMLTQESAGIHENLMQVLFNCWNDVPITLYNFDENRYETIVLSNYPDSYLEKGMTVFTEEDILDNDKNVCIGTIVFYETAREMNFHIAAAIQAYNMGGYDTLKLVDAAARENDKTIDQVLEDQTNVDFYKYTNTVGFGDSEYLTHVLSYVRNNGSSVGIKVMNEDGSIDVKEVVFESNLQLDSVKKM